MVQENARWSNDRGTKATHRRQRKDPHSPVPVADATANGSQPVTAQMIAQITPTTGGCLRRPARLPLVVHDGRRRCVQERKLKPMLHQALAGQHLAAVEIKILNPVLSGRIQAVQH